MRHIVLVGMMGAGKTTVGKALAGRRGWAFVDSDAQVESRAGRSVAEIWAADGEQAFRALEANALSDALSAAKPVVIAAAGGTVLEPDNWLLLHSHRPVVWLRADPATLAERLGDGTGRPLLTADLPDLADPARGPARILEELAAAREPLYAEVADVVVVVDGLSPSEVVDAVEAGLAAAGEGNDGGGGQRPRPA